MYEDHVKQAANFIRSALGDLTPLVGLTLGSGLGDLTEKMNVLKTLNYADIPHVPTPTVAGHAGELVIGTLSGIPIVGLKGRKHYYEVADSQNGMRQVNFLVHVLAELGVKIYFVTNAAGGLNTEYEVGDIMAITSHIRLQPDPLLGRELDLKSITGEKLARFQPMNDVYDRTLTELLLESGADHTGTYLAVTGPSYETDAECRAFRQWGADTVGMSTVPEVIVARNRGLRCVGFSCVTNIIGEDGTNTANHEEVKAILDSADTRTHLISVVSEFFSRLRKTL